MEEVGKRIALHPQQVCTNLPMLAMLLSDEMVEKVIRFLKMNLKIFYQRHPVWRKT